MKKLLVLFVCATIIFGEIAIMHFRAEAKRIIDERAAALLQQARAAIGGDAASVQNLVIKGRVSHKAKFPGQEERTMTGDLEMALDSNQIHKMVKIQIEGAPFGEVPKGERVAVEEKDVIIHRAEGGDKIHVFKGEHPELDEKIRTRAASHHQQELSRLWLGLLLKTGNPDLTYAGEGNVDGTACDIIEARGAEGFSTKLYLDKSSHLPVMLSYMGANPRHFIMMKKHGEAPANGQTFEREIFIHPSKDGKVIERNGDTKVFVREKGGEPRVIKRDPNAKDFPRVAMEEVEIQIRFADFRSVGGFMLPHKLTQIVNGQINEETTVDSYEINIPNFAERFKDDVLFIKNQQ